METQFIDILNQNAIVYKDYYIDPFTIESIVIGDKKYPGYTKYTIRTKDNVFLAKSFDNNGDIILREFKTLATAKRYINKIINKRGIKNG